MKRNLAALSAVTIVACGLVVMSGCGESTREPSATASEKAMSAFDGNDSGEPSASPGERPSIETGSAIEAMRTAAASERYLFLFIHRGKDSISGGIRDDFITAAADLRNDADTVSIDIASPDEKGFVDRFRLGSAPMPLVMAIAPNGAVTGAFTRRFTRAQLAESILSPCAERSLKAIQERKLVFLCYQNDGTKENDRAMRGVMEFKSDMRYAQATEIIKVNPAVEAELDFLKKMKIAYSKGEALTVFLAPPGVILGTYLGATDKATLEKTLLASMSGCGSGCGAGGCPPR